MTTQIAPPPAADLMPSDNYPSDKPNQVVWLNDPDMKPPVKTITFTNNTDHTVYPFFVAANSYDIYDTKDPSTRNYRGYIGFTWNGNNYLGLPAGQTITVTVPIAFWDSGRIYVASNNAYLINNEKDGQVTVANPYQYYQYNSDGTETLRYQQTMEKPISPSGQAAVVMWYQGLTVHGPADDAPAQLLEYSIKDPWLRDVMNPKIPADIGLGPLINYDVSYVDNMCLPVTMAATDVPVPNTSLVESYGWIGTSQTEDQFQKALKTFASSDSSNGLGLYFGADNNITRGYTKFNIPDSDVTVKLPSGAAAMADSPLRDARSSYSLDNNIYMLSSGGTAGIEAAINASPNPAGSTILPLTLNAGASGDEQKATLSQALPGTMEVTCTDLKYSNLIPAGTKLIKATFDENGTTGTATLSQATNPIPSGTSCTVNFKRPVGDYVTSTMLSLWYSWAEYYVSQNQQVGRSSYTGSITVSSSDPKVSRILTFDTPIPISDTQLPLVPGMLVTGPGIPTSSDESFCTIADLVENDGKTAIVAVKLSEFVTASSSGIYQFQPLQPIKGSSDPILQPLQLTFLTDADKAQALSFSQTVYQAMSAISTIPIIQGYPYLSIWVVYNVIGCNTGQVPNIGNESKIPDIASEITIKIKSALRGVPDFTDTTNWPESKWYPVPSTPTGGYHFNVYNLDPYVWFVHRQLGLTAYGFSVDDDTADVGANAATNLQINVGGLGDPPNLAQLGQWTNGTPYGPVCGSGTIQIVSNLDGTKTYKITNLPNTSDNPVYWKITNPDTLAGQQGAIVNGKYLQPGTRIVSTDLVDYGVIVDTPFTSDAVSGETSSYAFFGPVVGMGQAQSPNIISGLDATVIYQLNVIVTQTGVGVRVTGPGVPSGTMVQSVDPATQSITLTQPVTPQPTPVVYTFG